MLPPDALRRLADLLDEELVAIETGDHVAVGRICDEREHLLPIAAGATRAERDLAGIVVERSRRNERAAAARAGELYAELRRLERGRLTGSLPLGYKQRLSLGCALAHRPRVLFLDEPTGGVDPVARRGFWDLIYEQAAAGVTVFVTTHYMDEAEYCGRVSIMVQGRIVALDTPAGLKARTGGADMQDVFLRLVDA